MVDGRSSNKVIVSVLPGAPPPQCGGQGVSEVEGCEAIFQMTGGNLIDVIRRERKEVSHTEKKRMLFDCLLDKR